MWNMTGWWFQPFLLSRIYGMSSFPFDELIFFKMVTTTREIF
jgi:hypothetical protein